MQLLGREHPQVNVKYPNQGQPGTKARQHKCLSVFDQFSQYSVRGQIEKSAADMRHDQAKPKSRDFPQPQHADRAAEERSCFYSCHPTKRSRASQSRADQKTAERETFGNLVDAE